VHAVEAGLIDRNDLAIQDLAVALVANERKDGLPAVAL